MMKRKNVKLDEQRVAFCKSYLQQGEKKSSNQPQPFKLHLRQYQRESKTRIDMHGPIN